MVMVMVTLVVSDCLYLDMNGIVHVATHGPGTDPTKPLEENEAMVRVFKYIDKVVRLGRPKRMLYMCLDGKTITIANTITITITITTPSPIPIPIPA